MSEKIKNFFQKGDYENVLKETTFSDDAEDLLFRILSFEALCKYKDALQEYYKSRNLVENWDLVSSCKALMFLLVYFKKDDELKKELEHFRDFPYINQETEEFMRNLDDYIVHLKQYFNESNKDSAQNLQDIKDALFSGNNDEQLYAIKKIYDLESQGISCLSIVSDYLKSTSKFDTNYALLLDYAIFAKLPDKILFRKKDKYYSIIPEEYTTYLKVLSQKLNEKVSYMNMTEKNISIVRYISVLARPTFIYMLPEKMTTEDLDSLLAALVIQGSKLYGADITTDDYLKSLVFTETKVKKFEEIINIVQNEF
jgi:hypothetical protein